MSAKTRYHRGTKSSRLPDSTAFTIRSATSSGLMIARRKKALFSTERWGKPSVSTKPGRTVCTRTPRAASEPGERARERELRMLRGGVRSRRARTPPPRRRRSTLTTCEPCLQPGLERADAPDAAEVVRSQHRLDPLRLEREEAATTGDACVVHEQVDARMPLEDGRGGPVDLLPVGDVAELELASELERERFEPLLPPGDEHAIPAARDELARRCLSDAARRAGDDGRLHGATLRISNAMKL